MKCSIESTNDFKLLARLNRSVQALHAELFPSDFKPYNSDQVETAFRGMLADPNVYAFVAKTGDKRIGYTLCMIKRREENEFQYEKVSLLIDQIAVEPAHRNSGVARQLIEAVFSLADELNIAEVQVEHWEGNKGAGQFFSKLGFRFSTHRMIKH